VVLPHVEGYSTAWDLWQTRSRSEQTLLVILETCYLALPMQWSLSL